MRIVLPVIAAALALGGGAALAGSEPDHPAPNRIKAAEVVPAPAKIPAEGAIADPAGTGAGRAFDELRAVFPDLTKETFIAADADGDGLLAEDEIEAARTKGLLPS